MKEKLVQIFAAKCPPAEQLTPPQRRKLCNTLGLPVVLIMIANPLKAEEQADAVMAVLPSVSDANKQEIVTAIPQLSFLFEAAQPAATTTTTATRGRGSKKAEEPAPQAATTPVAAPAVQAAPQGAVSEGIDLRLQQVELRLQRMEEALGNIHQRVVDTLQNTIALAAMAHYAAQLNGHTGQSTVAGFATEIGTSMADISGGN